jgi:hypothetical protein
MRRYQRAGSDGDDLEIQNMFPAGHVDRPSTRQEYDEKVAGLVINVTRSAQYCGVFIRNRVLWGVPPGNRKQRARREQHLGLSGEVVV